LRPARAGFPGRPVAENGAAALLDRAAQLTNLKSETPAPSRCRAMRR
jgi:hypothetical protein